MNEYMLIKTIKECKDTQMLIGFEIRGSLRPLL